MADVLRQLWTGHERPSFATLQARDHDGVAGYELVLPPGIDSSGGDLERRLDAALAANPHYALARRLGQLSPVSVVTVASDPWREAGTRIGDAKPRVLATMNVNGKSES